MIIFKTVRWKNLLSTGNNFTEIRLNDKHSTILLGQSGSGKSTLLDAIAFALFNRPFRNINKNQLVNMVNGKNCVVEIEFSIGTQEYMIRRGIKPTIFEIYCDNVLVNQDSHSKDYQQYLERNILKFNFKAFTQIIVLGASNFTPFMQLKPADRRIIIEGLLDIEIFSVMNTLLKQRASSLRQAIQENEFAASIVKEKIAIQEKYIDDISKDKEEKIQENMLLIEKHKNDIEKIREDNGTLRDSIVALQGKIDFKNELQLQIEKIKDIKSKIDSNVKKTHKEIAFYEEHDTCPTCSQDIPEELKTVEIEKKTHKISEWQSGMNDAEAALGKFLHRMEEVKRIETEIEKLTYQIGKNESVISGINQFIKKIAQDTISLKEEQSAPSEKSEELHKLSEDATRLEQEKEQHSIQKNVQDLATMLLKDNGVKARIIKQYLPLINKHTNVFLNAMNFFVSFHIDEEFNEMIKSRGRDDFSYENFSEGEKQRIDLALLFTWRTIAKMKNSVNTNLLIMDEVLDSYLDTNATENVLQLLNSDMFRDTNIFVISHKETISDKFQKTIRFTKTKNFSTIS
jgi:DNA repair exonuclease SbcCD ATPase subunit